MKKLNIVLGIVIITSLLLVATPVAAMGGHTIDFESDTTGAKPNGWQSVDSTVTFFTDSYNADLQVGSWPESNNTQALGVYYDNDPSYLIMDFSVPMISISLDFGNDDPGWANVGDNAILTLYYGATQVGQVKVPMNANDLMDQSIAFSGIVFDRATFWYDVTKQTGLIEVVDNIDLELSPVEFTKEIAPEPLWLDVNGNGIEDPGEVYDPVTEGGDMDGRLEPGEDWSWLIKTTLTNISGEDIEVEKVHDRLGGDLEWQLVAWSAVMGSIDIYTKGKTEKVFINWYDGFTLTDGESVEMWIWLSPDINTGRGTANNSGKNSGKNDKGGHQEYTSTGIHCLNSGTWFGGYIGDEYIEASTNPVCVEVVEAD